VNKSRLIFKEIIFYARPEVFSYPKPGNVSKQTLRSVNNTLM